MATRKQDTIKATTTTTTTPNSQKDLQVLAPDIEIKISGKKVMVREYRFIEGLHIRSHSKQFIDGLQKLLQEGQASDYLDIISLHQDDVIELMSISCGLSADEINALSDNDGLFLADVWWTVNGPFFMRAVSRKVMLENTKARAAGQT